MLDKVKGLRNGFLAQYRMSIMLMLFYLGAHNVRSLIRRLRQKENLSMALWHGQMEGTNGDRNRQREDWPAGEDAPQVCWRAVSTSIPQN